MTLHDLCAEAGFDGKAAEILQGCGESLLQAVPDGVPPFMTREYYRKYYPLTGGPEEALSRMDLVAEIVAKNPFMAKYAWMVHYGLYCADPPVYALRDLPLPEKVFGENAGIFQLMIALSSLSLVERRYKSMGLPEQLFLDMPKGLGCVVRRFAASRNGIPGYTPNGCGWFRHHVNGRIFRIGRLEFMRSCWSWMMPAMFRNRQDGRIAALCPNYWNFDKDGLFTELEKDSVFTTSLKTGEDRITGTPIDREGYPLKGQECTLLYREWESIGNGWDLVLDVHIPSGPRLAPGEVVDSMRRAVVFFREYFHQKVIAFRCGSWLLNPDLAREMPFSRIAAFQKLFHLGPVVRDEPAVLNFVYGDPHADPFALPAENSLHRAIRKLRQEKIPLKCGYMVLAACELEQFKE